MKAFNNVISVDWADPIDEPSDEIMSKVIHYLFLESLDMSLKKEKKQLP